MLSSCSTAFVAELNGKTWCPFSRQSVTMTSTMAGSSSIMMIFAIKSQRGEYFRFEKKKAEMRIVTSLSIGRFTSDHDPRGRTFVSNERIKQIFSRATERNCQHVRKIILSDST